MGQVDDLDNRPDAMDALRRRTQLHKSCPGERAMMIGPEKASNGGYALPYLHSAGPQVFVRLRGEAGVSPVFTTQSTSQYSIID
jgi:hypothetical protein